MSIKSKLISCIINHNFERQQLNRKDAEYLADNIIKLLDESKCDCDCWYIAQQYENLWDNSHANHIHLIRVFIAMKEILRERYLNEDIFNALMKDAFKQAKDSNE